MPAALQVINTFAQSLTGGGGYEALEPGTGDSLTFATTQIGSRAYLADVRGVDDAGACEVSLIAQGFADQTLGLAGWVPDGSTLAPPNRATSISPPGFDQPIQPGNVLTVQVKGTAGDNVNVTLMIYHADLPGIAAVLRTTEAVRGATRNLLGVDVALDASSNAQGDWSSTVSLSAAGRRLNASKFYAVLGFTADVPCAAVAFTSFETGMLRIGGPVVGDGEKDANLLASISDIYNAALIPVINGANQDSVLLQCADPAASNVNVTVMLAELTSAL